MRIRLMIFLVIISLFACKKDKLTKDYSSFKGNYEWKITPLDDNNISANNNDTLTPTKVGYSISFELNDKGEALFYKNGSKISKNKYTITDKESSSPGNAKISIKLKGSLGSMSVNKNTLTLRLSGDTLLSIDGFPFPAVDKVENYHQGYGQMANQFIKK